MFKILTAAALASLVLSGPAFALDQSKLPPANAKKLSEIIAKVEQRPDFRYIGEIDWDDGGYEVTYYTTDNAKVEITFDAVTGNSKSPQ